MQSDIQQQAQPDYDVKSPVLAQQIQQLSAKLSNPSFVKNRSSALPGFLVDKLDDNTFWYVGNEFKVARTTYRLSGKRIYLRVSPSRALGLLGVYDNYKAKGLTQRWIPGESVQLTEDYGNITVVVVGKFVLEAINIQRRKRKKPDSKTVDDENARHEKLAKLEADSMTFLNSLLSPEEQKAQRDRLKYIADVREEEQNSDEMYPCQGNQMRRCADCDGKHDMFTYERIEKGNGVCYNQHCYDGKQLRKWFSNSPTDPLTNQDVSYADRRRLREITTHPPIDVKFVKEIALDGRPMFMACHAGKVYATCEEGGKMSVLDVESGAVVEEWTIPGAGTLTGVAVHGEHVVVADFTNHCIRVLDMEGKQERQFGTEGSGNGQFNSPSGVAIAGELLYVCDFLNDRVQVFGLDGTWVRSWGSEGPGEGQFKYLSGITVHGDEVYVADYGNHRVQVFGLDGRFRRMWGSNGTGDGEFDCPCDVIVHGELVYVTDIGNHRVQSFIVSDGEFVGSWGTYGSAAGEFNEPTGLCVDDQNRLWVCDTYNHRLQLFRVHAVSK